MEYSKILGTIVTKFDSNMAAFILGLVSAFSGWCVWWMNRVSYEKAKAVEAATKAYAAERDFQHIRRNQEQIKENLELFLREIDRRFDIIDRDVLEIKSYFFKKED
jgi:hypothetical protein